MGTTESRILHATDLIRQNLGQRVTLDDVAAPLGISRFTLSHSFKVVMRVSFRQYLMHCRIEWARTLLEETEHSITDIALMVGFGDLPRFDKVFKGQMGLSPSDYRKKLLANTVTPSTKRAHVTSPWGARPRNERHKAPSFAPVRV